MVNWGLYKVACASEATPKHWIWQCYCGSSARPWGLDKFKSPWWRYKLYKLHIGDLHSHHFLELCYGTRYKVLPNYLRNQYLSLNTRGLTHRSPRHKPPQAMRRWMSFMSCLGWPWIGILACFAIQWLYIWHIWLYWVSWVESYLSVWFLNDTMHLPRVLTIHGKKILSNPWSWPSPRLRRCEVERNNQATCPCVSRRWGTCRIIGESHVIVLSLWLGMFGCLDQ